MPRSSCRTFRTWRTQCVSRASAWLLSDIIQQTIFIDVYCKKGQIRQVIETQFSARLDGFLRDLKDTSHKFEVAMLLQIACEIDQIAYESSDSFLLKRLRPAEQQPLGEGCLRDTRVGTLQKVRAWLNDPNSNNILWIVGPPGVGKSTIATTIVRDDNYPCVKFFATRNFPDLRDTRRIWPTIAHSLAKRHDRLKAAIMRALGKKRNIDVGDDTAFDQFQNLIKEPLEAHSKENASASRSRANTYPVIMIDALDECETGKSWDSFLKSFGSWPNGIKLIITSRDNEELHDRLGGACRLDLAPGDSTDDVEVFFVVKFGEMKSRPDFKKFGLGSDWPGDTDIQDMKDYAAGLFIWADMVINYVAPNNTAGFDPTERLRRVLSDVRDEGRLGIKGENRVDNLYARIIYDAFVLAKDEERKRAKRILATILLVKAPLRKEDLHDVLWSDKWNSRIVVESTLSNLRPIIPAPEDKIRVFHKSVSDFGLSLERSSAALLRFIPDDVDRRSYIIDVEGENKELALACLRLMSRTLSRSSSSTCTNGSAGSAETLWEQAQSNSFSYSWQHWIGHLEDAGSVYHALLPNLKSLRGAMEVAYGGLERFSGELRMVCIEAVALIDSVCCSMELAVRCIDTISHGESDFKTLQNEVDERTKSLDVVRDHFQIAVVLRREFSTMDDSSMDRILRRKFMPSDQSKLDDECIPGTRTGILSKAKDWLKDPNSPNILWIVGAPGAGKSAIAATLMKEFSSKYICGGFFAKRDISERGDPTCIWRTLAYELMRSNAGVGGSIMEAMFLDGLSKTRNQENYLDLIIKAAEIQQCLPVVVVIDALDECFTNLEDDEPSKTFLRTVADCADLSQSFKLVITSRDLADIRCVLSGVSHEIVLPTGTETSVEARADIETFFQSKLAHLPRTSYWLSEDILSQLVEQSAGSFIWAKMVVGLVMLNADGSLEDIVTGNMLGSAEDVDILYAKVLVETLGQLSEKERCTARAILSAIVLAKDPLERGFLEQLPDNDINTAKKVFGDLRSIIAVDENLSVRIPHKSFSDFFLHEGRCSNAMRQLKLSTGEQNTYLIRKKDDNATLAIACLYWMKNNLAFNACSIPTSHLMNESLQQLEVEHMDLTLVYTCRYWGEHLRQATRDNGFRAQAQPLLHTFFHQKALSWLEVLSLAKAVTSAKESLMAAWENFEGYDNDLAVFADDILKFVTHFEYPIAMAAPHVYVSALPFSPSNSRIFQVYAPRFPNLFSVTSGRREDWGDAPVKGDGHDNDVRCVSFFPDGSRLASAAASRDQSVHIWNSRTGKAISPPFKHDSDVWSTGMAVSPDGKFIASGGGKGALSIWDSETGARKLNLTGAHGESVAFSPDGSRIVTSSGKKTVKVWDTASGKLCLGRMTGHTGLVCSVAFSPDGTLIASGSHDDTIRIWDATTGKSHGEPLVEHSNSVLCLTFTADGHYLASGSLDDTIRLWDVIDGFTQTSFINSGSPVYSISFSPKSEILASGHNDGSLHFWDLRDGELHQLCNPIHGHTKDVNSIAFSSDGLLLASGSDDKSIKIWAVPTVTTCEASHGALANLKHDPPLIS
ncbi:hypothetical protein SCHPADRAFT_690865 [Schizopora paradoxa]|uniref:AAA+ ATPase domain-containing protein n=1 Tax=Schizopora paradoxa TaxID=27342 RepID=A0A0H2R3N1_9AGAM|nr:hypothetical protein SCHPADRAFT_690865 [Schizopora paradoxa]